MLDIRCPACDKLFFRASSEHETDVEVKCARSGKRSSCGWTGIIHLSSAPVATSTAIPSRYLGVANAPSR